MPTKFKIESPEVLCPYCNKILPTVKVEEHKLADFYDYEILDMSQVVNVWNHLFHRSCVEKEEFSQWLICFLKKKGKFKSATPKDAKTVAE